MDGSKRPADRKTGSVKSPISSYRERILEANPTMKKFQTNYPEKVYTKTRELHQAKRESDHFTENKRLAESATAKAKSELSAAKKTVKDLTLRLEESNLRAKADIRELEKLKMGRRREGERNSDDSECAKVMVELEPIKRELSTLKLDMAFVLEEKRRADKERESAWSRAQSCLSAVDALNKEIEEINEEHVLVELARIEAMKECEEVEAQRREEAEKYSAAVQETRKKRQSMVREIEEAEELEKKLALTVSDVTVLASELKQVKEMDKRLERNETLNHHAESNFQGQGESGSVSLLESVMKELEAAKKELTALKEEGFQFMASMDIIRNERKHVEEEIARLGNKETKSEITIQNLSSKLLRAKAKLEATSAAAEKAKSITSSLSLTLEQLQSEAETAKKERPLISEETAVIKAEVQRTESEIDLAEERLQVALQDLKTAKSSEATALENLKALVEKTMRNRASSTWPSSRITISRYEYEYLTGQAAGAKEIADKKVAAAQAWIEALKASEKETQIKSELLRSESRNVKVEEECKVYKTEGPADKNKMAEHDFENWRRSMETEKMNPGFALPSTAMNRSVKMTPARRVRTRISASQTRISASPLVRGMPTPTSITIRRRRKVMRRLAKFFTGKSNEGNP